MRTRTLLAAAVLAVVVTAIPGCGGGGDKGGGSWTPTAASTPAPTPVPTPTPSAYNVTGNWRSEARAWNFQLEQRGTTLTGIVLGFKNQGYDPSDPLVQITGTVSSSGKVNFKAGAWALEFDGSVTSNTKMTGQLYDCGNGCRWYGEVLNKN